MAGFNAGTISAKVTADISDFNKKMNNAKNSANGFGSTMGKIGGGIATVAKGIALGATVAGGAMVALGVSSVKASAEAEKQQAMLEHAVLNVTKATKEQLKATEDLADALEKKGVLDGDNIKQGLAQLSTFGLSNEAVRGLGGSLADLAVNQYGVNASGEQLSDTANMIAKALNGQFGVLEKSGIRFSEAQKHAIEYGTEMEKVTAINEGFAQNLKFTNATALGTFEGKMAKLKVTVGNLKEALGKKIQDAIVKIGTKVADWIEKMGGVDAILERIKKFLEPIVNVLKILWQNALITFNAIKQAIIFLLPVLTQLWNAFSKQLWPALVNLYNAIKPLLPIIGVALVIAIGAIIVALTIAIKIISLAINIIATLIRFVIDLVRVFIQTQIAVTGAVIGIYKSIQNWIQKAVGVFFTIQGAIGRALSGVWDAITKPFREAFDWVKDNVGKVVEKLKDLNPFKRHSPSLFDLVSAGTQAITGQYQGMFEALQNMSSNFSPTSMTPAIASAGDTNNSVDTKIFGNINIGNQGDANNFMARLTKNQELANKGMTVQQ